MRKGPRSLAGQLGTSGCRHHHRTGGGDNGSDQHDQRSDRFVDAVELVGGNDISEHRSACDHLGDHDVDPRLDHCTCGQGTDVR